MKHGRRLKPVGLLDEDTYSACGEKCTLTEAEIMELYRKLVASLNLLEEVTDPASEGFCNISSLELLGDMLTWCNQELGIMYDCRYFDGFVGIVDDITCATRYLRMYHVRDVGSMKALIEDKPKVEKYVKDVWNRTVTA